MSLLLDPKATISIDVKFYDDQEKKDFGKWANATKINSVAGHTIQVPAAEFLTYFLFHKKGLSPLRYPDLEAIKKGIQDGNDELAEWVSYDGKTLHVCPDVESLENSFTEHLGEAGGLAVTNRIHNLNEADWVKIPVITGPKGRKTLDWGYSSDGTNFIEVEAKGSFCERVDLLKGLSGHKVSIKAKKEDSGEKHHPRFNKKTLRYGTITSISEDPDSLLTVRLVDPEGDEHERTPHDTRILKRLAWAGWVIRLIASRTHLSVALQNRLAVLLRVDELSRYDNLPLRGGTGKPMPGEQFVDRFFVNRTTSREFQTAGALTPFDEEHLLFVGLGREWFLPLIGQQFNKISEMNFEPRSMATKLDCVVTPHQLETDFGDISREGKSPLGNLVQFERKAILHQSPAGMVFGLVSKHE